MVDELISKQKVIDKLDEAFEGITKNVSKESDAYHIVYGTVDITKCMIMTIQPEIVRCKDCRYGILDSGFPHQYFCKFKGNEWNNDDYFCGHAKKREVTT